MTAFTGTGDLARHYLRLDRVLAAVSGVALVVLAVFSAQATLALYPTPESLGGGAAELLANPSVLALYGPLSDPTSPDSFAVFKTVLLGGVFIGLLAYAIVRRHTRVDEEAGRGELIAAGAVGRRAPVTAAVVVALVVSAVICGASALGLAALGMDPVGSAAFGLAWFTAACFMAGTTAVAAQLTTTARATSGISLAVLLTAYLLRAVGDTAAADSPARHLSWLSPLGWSQKVAAFGADRFWVGGLGLLWLVATLAVAYALLERRDLGAGLIASRPGRARANAALAGPGGLAWRLQRPSVIGWTIGMAVIGAVVGSLAGSAADMLNNSGIRDLLEKFGGASGSLLDVFFRTELAFIAAAAAIAGVAAARRLHHEEDEDRAEPMLAGAVSRPHWMGAYSLIAFLLPAWLVTVVALSMGLTSRGVAEAPGMGDLLVGALATLPGVWVVVGAALALFGILPRWTGLAWGVLALVYGLAEFGAMMNLPEWVVDLTPIRHLSDLPGGSFAVVPSIVITAIALGLLALGLVAFRRRDLG